MILDAEILRIAVEAFDALHLEIAIKLNHRRILDGLFAVAGVPQEKMRSISSAVDTLDKTSWAEVKKEMLEKWLSDDVADRVGVQVTRNGGMREMIKLLRSDSECCANSNIKESLDQMDLLVAYLEAMGVVDKVSFDLSLSRGLDYYTGLIYEVVMPTLATASRTTGKKKHQPIQVGSVAAGGRYDGLVGM
jgi:histidyl-tRNA synthetase